MAKLRAKIYLPAVAKAKEDHRDFVAHVQRGKVATMSTPLGPAHRHLFDEQTVGKIYPELTKSVCDFIELCFRNFQSFMVKKIRD